MQIIGSIFDDGSLEPQGQAHIGSAAGPTFHLFRLSMAFSDSVWYLRSPNVASKSFGTLQGSFSP